MKPNAPDNADRFYVNTGAGVSIMRNVLSQGSENWFDVGPKVDLSVGYDVTRNIAVELQSGFAHNSWPAAPGVLPPSMPGGFPQLVPGVSTDIWTVPVMVNGIWKRALNRHWQVYGGAGAGALISTLQLQNIFVQGGNINSTDCEFGYQVMLGIKYRFNDHWETDLGYDFLGSLDHHWSGNGGGLTTNPTYMHSVLLGLTYRF